MPINQDLSHFERILNEIFISILIEFEKMQPPQGLKYFVLLSRLSKNMEKKMRKISDRVFTQFFRIRFPAALTFSDILNDVVPKEERLLSDKQITHKLSCLQNGGTLSQAKEKYRIQIQKRKRLEFHITRGRDFQFPVERIYSKKQLDFKMKIANSDEKLIHQLKTGKHEFNEKDLFSDKDLSPIIIAAQYHQTEIQALIYQLILSTMFSESGKNNSTRTQLEWAILCGQIDEVKKLCDSNTINQETVNGESLLYLACLIGCKPIVEFLLDKGADVGFVKQGLYGIVPVDIPLITIASEYGYYEIVALLLENNVDVNGCRNKKISEYLSPSPLYVAVENGHSRVVDILLQHGADPNDVLFVAAVSALLTAVTQNDKEIVSLLLQYGADPNNSHCEITTCLEEAVRRGLLEIVEMLLKAGADPNQDIKSKAVPLVTAIKNFLGLKNNKKIVELLIAYGADVYKTNRDDTNAICLAQGDLEMETLLTSYLPQKDQQKLKL